MDKLADIARTEPVLIQNAATALVAVGIAFGLPITPEQKLALGGLAVPAVALLGAWCARRVVVPTAKIAKP